jgi:hypothetical protein
MVYMFCKKKMRMLYYILIFYFYFLSNLTNFISFHISNIISKLHSIVLNFHFEDLVTSEEFLSLLGKVLLALLNGILSLFDEEDNPEDPYPEGEDPEDPYPEGEDPEDPYPEGEDPEGVGPYPDGDDPNGDRPDQKDKGKGKARAATPESEDEEPEKPSTENDLPEEQFEKDLDEEQFEKDLEEAIQNSKIDNEDKKNNGESSKQGARSGYLEKLLKQENESEYRKSKDGYKEAVREYNRIQSDIVDNPEIDPIHKRDLLEKSIEIRQNVDYYKNKAETLKEELNRSSSEEEYYSEEEYSSEDNSNGDNRSEDSSSEKSRPSKRPRK